GPRRAGRPRTRPAAAPPRRRGAAATRPRRPLPRTAGGFPMSGSVPSRRRRVGAFRGAVTGAGTSAGSTGAVTAGAARVIAGDSFSSSGGPGGHGEHGGALHTAVPEVEEQSVGAGPGRLGRERYARSGAVGRCRRRRVRVNPDGREVAGPQRLEPAERAVDGLQVRDRGAVAADGGEHLRRGPRDEVAV